MSPLTGYGKEPEAAAMEKKLISCSLNRSQQAMLPFSKSSAMFRLSREAYLFSIENPVLRARRRSRIAGAEELGSAVQDEALLQ